MITYLALKGLMLNRDNIISMNLKLECTTEPRGWVKTNLKQNYFEG
jgi:hypothetical protein